MPSVRTAVACKINISSKTHYADVFLRTSADELFQPTGYCVVVIQLKFVVACVLNVLPTSIMKANIPSMVETYNAYVRFVIDFDDEKIYSHRA